MNLRDNEKNRCNLKTMRITLHDHVQRKTLAKCVRQQKRGALGGGWALRGIPPNLGPSRQDGGERHHGQDGSL